MGRFLLLLLCIVGVACSTTPREASTPPPPPMFRIVTWNLYYEPRPAEQIATAIRAIDADVVCLQETNPPWEAVLREGLTMDYPHMFFNHDGGTAILSRLPLVDVVPHRSPLGYNGAITANIATPLGKVRVVNVHLHPAFEKGGGPTVASIVRGAGQEHIQELEAYVPHADGDERLVVLGDFNEEHDEGLKWLERRGLRDVLREAHPRGATFTQRLGPRGMFVVNLQLDHVLVGSGLRAKRVTIGEAAGSDHRPVVADVVFEWGA